MAGPILIETQPAVPGTIKKDTIYLYEDTHWFVFGADVDIATSPIIKDKYARVYFTGAGKPQVTTNELATGTGVLPKASFDLGVPAPTVKAKAVLASGEQDDPEGIDDDESRYYVYTYVTATGEESAPGPLSNKIVLKTPLVDEVNVTVSAPANNTSNITHIKLYRSAVGADDGIYQLVSEFPISTSTIKDTLTDSDLGPVLETQGYLPPPEDLAGLIRMDGGMLAGFSGRDVCVSESFLPYAWPERNRQKSRWPIVGMVAVSGGAVVCTEGEPYLMMGTSPDSYLLEQTGVQQACVSKRSIVGMDGFVLYASPDGLVMVNGSGAELISDELIKPKQWRELIKPNTIHAYQHEGEYIAFYGDTSGNGNGTGGFIVNPKRRDIRFFDFYATAAYRDLKSDSFYLLMSGQLKKWAGGENLIATWRSKLFEYFNTNFALCQVIAPDISGVHVRVIADGKTFHEQTLSNEPAGTFWLPAGLHNQWQVEVTTTKPIHSITLANSHHELD